MKLHLFSSNLQTQLCDFVIYATFKGEKEMSSFQCEPVTKQNNSSKQELKLKVKQEKLI